MKNKKDLILILLVVFLASYGATLLLTYDKSPGDLPGVELIDKRTKDTEIAFIFFGCSSCPAASDEILPEVLVEIAERLKKYTVAEGYDFTFIGVSNERRVKKGLNYLTGIASFDEVALGNAMSNVVLQRYVWQTFDHPLSASTPQVIITKRKYLTRSIGEGRVIRPEILSEEIMARRIGVQYIRELNQKNTLRNILDKP